MTNILLPQLILSGNVVSNYEIQMTASPEEVNRLRKAREAYYKSQKPSNCPALEGVVHFTSDGFHHLRYGVDRRERDKRVQKMKLVFLPKAIDVIKKATTYQEYREETLPVGKLGRDGFRKTSLHRYWGLRAIINHEYRIRVIVRQVGNGELHFWSVMPDWIEVRGTDGQTQRWIGKKDMAHI